jgi:hypothetical protein
MSAALLPTALTLEQPQVERPRSRRGCTPRRALELLPSAPVAVVLRDYFRAFPPGTELATSMRGLAQEIGRPYTGQISVALGQLVKPGVVERLPGKALRLRVCAMAAVPYERAFTIHELVVQHLSIYPPGAEVRVNARQIAAQPRCGTASAARALQELEAQGLIRRTITRRGTHLTILASLSASPPPVPTPAPEPHAPPPSGRPDRPTPHAALWRHLLANGPRLAPINWLLSGLTVTVWPASTELTCVDAPRVETARALHEPLVAALRALELPDTLVIAQPPTRRRCPTTAPCSTTRWVYPSTRCVSLRLSRTRRPARCWPRCRQGRPRGSGGMRCSTSVPTSPLRSTRPSPSATRHGSA